jgi:hypothetical protein
MTVTPDRETLFDTHRPKWNSNTMDLDLTDHADRRSQQRGVNRQTIAIIAALADRTSHVGSGVVYKFLSRKRINELRRAGLIAPVCERLNRTSLLLDPDSGTIISVLKGGHNAHGLKRYRQGRWYHQRPQHTLPSH